MYGLRNAGEDGLPRSLRPPDNNAEERQKAPPAATPRPARDKRTTSGKQAPSGGCLSHRQFSERLAEGIDRLMQD